MAAEPGILEADWSAPPGVHAITTTRRGGCSAGAWDSFNLARHAGDDPARVERNRALLQQRIGMDSPPQWLRQVHGTAVVDACADGRVLEADAAYSDRGGVICAVLTADCLPVVIASRDGSEVAVAHCGWRGLAAGVLDYTLARFHKPMHELLAWLGPAISQAAFEVGPEVREAFRQSGFGRQAPPAVEAAFLPASDTRYHADLYALATLALQLRGVESVSGGGRCTFSEPREFFSYRRDGPTGRMATLVWIAG